MYIGPNLFKLRTRKGLAQTELAALAGTSQQHISLIERGASGVELSTLLKILSALGCRLSIEEGQDLGLTFEARRKGWQRLEALERELPADTPAVALARIGEMADLYLRLQGRQVPGPQDLADAAKAVGEWRKRLAAARVRN